MNEGSGAEALAAQPLRTLTALSPRRWTVLLAVVAIGTRLLWVACLPERTPRFDETAYVAHARALAEGRGYVDANRRPTAYWPVGYPVLLAAGFRLFGTGPAVGAAIQTILGTLTCLLVSLIGTRAFGRLIGRTAALGLAVYPTHVFYTTLYLAEPLGAMLVALATWLVVFAKRHVALVTGGMALGIAVLARPVLVALPLALPAWSLRRDASRTAGWLRVLLVASGMVLTVGPWVVRNHREVGAWTVSTTGGHTFWIGNHPGAFGGYRHDGTITERLRVNGELQYDRGFRLGLNAIADAPLRAAVRLLQKASYFFALETDGVLWNLKGLMSPTPPVVTLVLVGLAGVGYITVTALALLGVAGSSPGDSLTRWFVVLATYQLAMAMIFLGDPRYHFALVPIAMIFAAKGLFEWIPRLRSAEGRAGDETRRVATRWSVLLVSFSVLVIVNLALKVLEARILGPA